jgi:hypothetical protein
MSKAKKINTNEFLKNKSQILCFFNGKNIKMLY